MLVDCKGSMVELVRCAGKRYRPVAFRWDVGITDHYLRMGTIVLSYLVVMSQFGRMGRGVNGHTLYKFLRCYFNNQTVSIVGAGELSQSADIAADTVFLGLPTTLSPENLRRLRFRRLILFDLFDESKPQWDESNREHLLNHADMYLKPWYDRRWKYGIRMGLAPIRRYEKLRTALRVKGLFDSLSSTTAAKHRRCLSWCSHRRCTQASGFWVGLSSARGVVVGSDSHATRYKVLGWALRRPAV